MAKAIVSAAPVISTQVINEFHNVARRKLGLDMATRHRVAIDLLQSCRVIAVDQATEAEREVAFNLVTEVLDIQQEAAPSLVL